MKPLFAGGPRVSTRTRGGMFLLAPLRGYIRSCTLLYAKTNVRPSLNCFILGRCLMGMRKLAETRRKYVHLLPSVSIPVQTFLGRSNMLKSH